MSDVAPPEPGDAIEIRELRSGDASVLVELFEAVLPGFESSMAATGPALFLDDHGSFALGAYLGGMPAGLVWGFGGDRKPLGDVNYWWTLD